MVAVQAGCSKLALRNPLWHMEARLHRPGLERIAKGGSRSMMIDLEPPSVLACIACYES